jgi:hypothetical protein
MHQGKTALVWGIAVLCISSNLWAIQPPEPHNKARGPLQQRYNFYSDNPNARLALFDRSRGRENGDDGEWMDVCALPCSKVLDIHEKYRIYGDDIVTSSSFLINPNYHNIQVRAGSKSQRIVGIVLTPVGGLALLTGLSLYLTGAILRIDKKGTMVSGDDEELGKSFQTAGVITGLVGFGTMIAGILMITNNSTKLDYENSPPVMGSVPLGRGMWLSPSGLHF